MEPNAYALGLISVLLFFPTLFVEYGLLVMAACACLPDDPPPAPDLGAFYDAERVYLWSVLIAFEASHVLHMGCLVPKRFSDGSPAAWATFSVPLAAHILLFFVRDRRAHIVALAVLLIGTVARAQLHRLGG